MIRIDNVSMVFNLGRDRIMSLKEMTVAFLRGKLHFDPFTALDNISLHMEPGEVVGLIGRNGAGKSTLMKLIAGVLKPTKGTVRVEGSIAPMIELGAGFDFELNARENIMLNAAILGFSKPFILSKMEDIIAFSELDEFMDVPLRNYSSGMITRLAFSISTVVEPQILLVDEILSVGDESFQKKSKARMQSLMHEGVTVLFVSHSLGDIMEICDRVIWLEHGKIRMEGLPDEVCAAYREGGTG
jgi:ABC-2 type transport system ATP-binding protein